MLRINNPDDETIEIFLNDVCIGTFTHDQNGWGGMEIAETISTRIALELNIEVINTYDSTE